MSRHKAPKSNATQSRELLEADMGQPAHIREPLMKLYGVYDDVVAKMRQEAAKDIRWPLNKLRWRFTELRQRIIGGEALKIDASLFEGSV